MEQMQKKNTDFDCQHSGFETLTETFGEKLSSGAYETFTIR